MGTLLGTGCVTRPLLAGATALALTLGAGCARTARPQVSTPPLEMPAASWLYEENAGAQRLAQFGTLHESVRLLLIAGGAQAEWVRHGVAELPLAACRELVSTQVDLTLARDCSMVAVDATTAVMIMSESPSCERWSCFEHSWVFLSDYGTPLPLPPRHAADYGSLRADLSREVAETLWLAGYRGRSDRRIVDGSDPYAPEDADPYAEQPPSIASYRSCALAPDQHELVCRSQQGGVIALNPRTSAQRLVASLERELTRGAQLDHSEALERVWWTPRGELAMKVKMQRHPLCGESACTLVGVLAWPAREGDSPRFMRVD